jgi:hypothetical protein
VILTVADYGLAAFLNYAGFWLIEVESDTGHANQYTFEMEQKDFDAYSAAWASEDGQHIPNGKAFCQSLKKIDALQRHAYHNGGHWADHNYVAGKSQR